MALTYNYTQTSNKYNIRKLLDKFTGELVLVGRQLLVSLEEAIDVILELLAQGQLLISTQLCVICQDTGLIRTLGPGATPHLHPTLCNLSGHRTNLELLTQWQLLISTQLCVICQDTGLIRTLGPGATPHLHPTLCNLSGPGQT